MPTNIRIRANGRDALRFLKGATLRMANEALVPGIREGMKLALRKARTKNYGFTDRTGLARRSIRLGPVRRATRRTPYVRQFFRVHVPTLAKRPGYNPARAPYPYIVEWMQNGRFSWARRAIGAVERQAVRLVHNAVDRWSRGLGTGPRGQR